MRQLRNRHLFIVDVLLLVLIPSLAFTLRLEELNWWPQSGRALIIFTTVALLVKLPVFYGLRLYDRYWGYASANDLLRVVVAVGISTAALSLGVVGSHSALDRYGLAVYRTVPILDGLLTFMAVAGLRAGVRVLHHWYYQHRKPVDGRRVLVAGAGEAGTNVVREMRANPQLNMEPVAFVDDDASKVGTHIQGLCVLGMCRDIPRLVEKYRFQRIVVAMPSVPPVKRKEIIDICRQTGLPTDSVPGIYEILAGRKTISRLPKVDINSLLRREPVEIDQTEVAACLQGATVLVTGAGGSIGSELCRQVARFRPKEIILLGHGENSIFEINLDLSLSFPKLVTHPTIADVRDQERMYRIVEKYRPNVIFHAAAHKHVPLMEMNVDEAITNNVFGTYSVLQAAEQYGVNRLVLISTDKAVNPVCTMGVTKYLAELLAVASAKHSGSACMAVRFGNVLGSRGSVIPVFLQQIAAGGPVTITHPDMQRYFMTIPEAVQLVLQATVLGRGGEVFVLDMGQPVRIQDLATDLIRLSGLEPGRDIEIAYVGMRPGEKLSEELFLSTEQYQRTKHNKIFISANGNTVEAETVARVVNLALTIMKYQPGTPRSQTNRAPIAGLMALQMPEQLLQNPGYDASRVLLSTL